MRPAIETVARYVVMSREAAKDPPMLEAAQEEVLEGLSEEKRKLLADPVGDVDFQMAEDGMGDFFIRPRGAVILLAEQRCFIRLDPPPAFAIEVSRLGAWMERTWAATVKLDRQARSWLTRKLDGWADRLEGREDYPW